MALEDTRKTCQRIKGRVPPKIVVADPDGTLHIRKLTIPPSDVWSLEFKAFYAKWVAEASEQERTQVPARSTPKAEWDKFDALAEDRYKAGPLAKILERFPVDVVDTKIGDVRAGIVSPRNGIAPANQERVLIDLHAGGFVYGRGLIAGQLESVPVASIGRIKVITIDYRQAPFNEYPAASEDVEAVYRELLKQYDSEAMGIIGCSANGALTAQTVAWFQSKGLPQPGRGRNLFHSAVADVDPAQRRFRNLAEW